MATQQQIDDAVAAAEAYAATKAAYESALGALQRSQAVADAANVLIERLSSDGGADPDFWAALMNGIDALKIEQAARTQTFSDASTAMTTAKSELDAAIAALGVTAPLLAASTAAAAEEHKPAAAAHPKGGKKH